MSCVLTRLLPPILDNDLLTPTGYTPPPQHSSRHGPRRTQHTASTAAVPRYPQGRRPTPADAPAPLPHASCFVGRVVYSFLSCELTLLLPPFLTRPLHYFRSCLLTRLLPPSLTRPVLEGEWFTPSFLAYSLAYSLPSSRALFTTFVLAYSLAYSLTRPVLEGEWFTPSFLAYSLAYSLPPSRALFTTFVLAYSLAYSLPPSLAPFLRASGLLLPFLRSHSLTPFLPHAPYSVVLSLSAWVNP